MAAQPGHILQSPPGKVTPVACFECPIRRTGICKSVTDQQLPGYFALATEHEFAPGQTIVETGTPAEYVDIVRRGSAFAYRILPDLRRAILQILMPTDVFGLTSFGEHALTVQAAQETLICRFRKSDLEELMVDYPEIQRAVRSYVTLLSHILEERAVTLGLKNSLQRVIAFIVYIWGYQDWPADEKVGFELPLSRPEIADLTGMSPETVSKCFTALRKMQLIDLPRPQEVRVLDKEKLLALGYAPTDLSPDMQALLKNFQKLV